MGPTLPKGWSLDHRPPEDHGRIGIVRITAPNGITWSVASDRHPEAKYKELGSFMYEFLSQLFPTPKPQETPMTNTDEQQLEANIKAAGADKYPRLTPEHIDGMIKDVQYIVPDNTWLTLCVITLINGCTVSGESPCISKENFRKEIGEQVSFKKAREKIWELEGYHSKASIWENDQHAKNAAKFFGRGQTPHIQHVDESAFIAEPVSDYAESEHSPSSDYLVNEIAHACHRVNDEYNLALGVAPLFDWEHAPENHKLSYYAGVRLHLNNPMAGAHASHTSWYKAKVFEGWTYGTEKDLDRKTHPCLVMFKDLPVAQQAKDHIFRAVVLESARILGMKLDGTVTY